MREIYVGLMEYGCPLEGCSMQNLTSPTMTKLRIKRFLPTQLILNSSTVTTTLIQRFEIRVIFMDFVWFTKFPFVVLAFEVGGFVTALLCGFFFVS